jgi:hypothetical protein
MADAVFQTIGRWATAAICAAGLSFAHAQPDGQPHAASVSFHQSDGSTPGNWLARQAFAPQSPAGYLRMARNYPEGRHGAARSSAATRHGAGPRLSSSMPMAVRGMPYRPVSEAARNVPRPTGHTAYMRAGSIRDAVTRYNEERGEPGRPVPRPPTAGERPPDSSLYRN